MPFNSVLPLHLRGCPERRVLFDDLLDPGERRERLGRIPGRQEEVVETLGVEIPCDILAPQALREL